MRQKSFVLLMAGVVGLTVSGAIAEPWQWSLRKGKPFDPDHPDPSLKSVTSNILGERRHISAIRVTSGDGLDVVTFDGAQLAVDAMGVLRWADVTHADGLIYKYGEREREYVRSAEPQPGVLVADDQGTDRGSHPLHLIRLAPEDRLEQITVFTPSDKSFAVSGITFHIVSLFGGSREVTVGGAKFSEADPHTTIGVQGREVIGIRIFFGKALDALGVVTREDHSQQ